MNVGSSGCRWTPVDKLTDKNPFIWNALNKGLALTTSDKANHSCENTLDSINSFALSLSNRENIYAKQKQPGCKKVRGQSEATMVISDQKL